MLRARVLFGDLKVLNGGWVQLIGDVQTRLVVGLGEVTEWLFTIGVSSILTTLLNHDCLAVHFHSARLDVLLLLRANVKVLALVRSTAKSS